METGNRKPSRSDSSADQNKMESRIKTEITAYLEQTDSINGMMRPEFVACSFEERTVKVAFPVLEWQKNRVGYMHGGAIAAAFDIGTGLLARFLAEENFAPTISLDTVFLRPISVGDVFEIHIRTNLSGRKLSHLYCEGFVRSSGKLAATATACYLNENTKERSDSENLENQKIL